MLNLRICVAINFWFYNFGFMFLVICFWFYGFGFMFLVLCFVIINITHYENVQTGYFQLA
jgi:hypothetical protein